MGALLEMSCSFDLAHYRELLEAARTGGYRFARFGEGPVPKDLLLRHDIDLSLPAALEMAVLDGGDARGIVAAIFQALQRVDQLFGNRSFAEDANDAAHRPLLPHTVATG